jgi:nucleoside 2-deoxyribosyltransferase
MKRIYLAGPMRGLAHGNYPAFDRWAIALREQGYEVVNPADIDRAMGLTGEESNWPRPLLRKLIMRDLKHLVTCDILALMPGWETSKGCAVEIALAEFVGMKVIYL